MQNTTRQLPTGRLRGGIVDPVRSGQHSRRRRGFRRELALDGWSPGSVWGYDEALECYWAEVCGREKIVRVGPEGLLVTLDGLARVLARTTGCSAEDAYLALCG